MSSRSLVVAVTLVVVLAGASPVGAVWDVPPAGAPPASVAAVTLGPPLAAIPGAADPAVGGGDGTAAVETGGGDDAVRHARATRAAAREARLRAAGVDDAAAVEAAANGDHNVSVAVPDTFEVSVASGATVPVLVGVSDAAGAPVADVALDVLVEDPAGDVVTRSVTTDADGFASVSYDTTGRPDGSYLVTVEEDGTERAFDFFDVGALATAVPDGDAFGEVGSEFTVAVFVGDGGVPVAERDLSLTTFGPTGVDTVNVTTDADGYADLTLSLDDPGEYFGFGERFDVGYGVNATETVGYVEAAGDQDATVRPGDPVVLTGRVLDDGQPLASTPIEVVAAPLGFGQSGPTERFDVTTDAYGAFAVRWDVPADVGTNGTVFYEVTLRDGAGDPVGAPPAFVDVGGEGLAPDEELAVVVDLDREFVAPGGAVDVTVTVVDRATGAAVPGATVDARTTVGFGSLVVDARELATDADGTASYTVSVPAGAPTPAFLDVVARATAGTRDGVGFGFGDVATVAVDSTLGDDVAPGGSDTVTFTATDVATGGPAAGVPVRLAAGGDLLDQSVFFTGAATTGGDGTATIRPAIPATFSGSARYYQRGPGLFFDWVVDVGAQDVTLSGVPETAAPGETVTVGYATTPDAGALVTVTEFPSASSFVGRSVAGGVLAPGETLAFDVPADAPDGATYAVDVDTLTDDGRFGFAYETFAVAGDGQGPATRTVSVDDATVTPGGTVSVPVRVDAAPDGLDRVEVRVTVEDAGVATLAGATAGDLDGFTLESVAADGTAVTFSASDDLDAVGAGAGGVVLGRVAVAGVAAGNTTLSVDVVALVDDQSRSVPTVTVDGTLAVAAADGNPFDRPIGVGLPGDLDGDGRYEDVDGDGDADFDDAIELAFVDGSSLTAAQTAALDFDGDGAVDFADAIELAFLV